MRFSDRTDAGTKLARELTTLDLTNTIVVGLPRGGVVVAAPVAAAREAPLDVLVSRKVGAPNHPEFGIGAVAEGGVTVVDTELLEAVGVSDQRFLDLADAERVELDRRVLAYHRGHKAELLGRDVVLVDDGLATGSTAEAAIESVRMRKPHRVVLAVPVAASDSLERLRGLADEVVCLSTPSNFESVGRHYDDFRQVSDEEVLAVLADSV